MGLLHRQETRPGDIRPISTADAVDKQIAVSTFSISVPTMQEKQSDKSVSGYDPQPRL